VRTKDSCWSVGTIYDPRELPRVSTAGPGIGRGVTWAATVRLKIVAVGPRNMPRCETKGGMRRGRSGSPSRRSRARRQVAQLVHELEHRK
jgi:hypothetical protein